MMSISKTSNHMPKIDEELVQWILLKNPEFLSKILNITLDRCVGTEVTTRYGRLDFIYEFDENGLLLIELETNIDSTSKLEHTTNQISRYLNIIDLFPKKEVKLALVYAADGTPERFKEQLDVFKSQNNLILKSYTMHDLFQVYDKMLDRLNRTSGISLGRAVALGITSISWLNKFMIALLDGFGNQVKHGFSTPVDTISWSELKDRFTSNTNFYVLKRFAEDFELVEVKNHKRTKIFELTKYGQQFRDELATMIILNSSDQAILNSAPITLSQKRLLIEILLNGNFTKIKVNIFHFLRFVHLTEGNWLPKPNSKFTKAELQYLNNIFRTSYNSRTLKDIVQQTCTFCEELGLVEKIPAQNQVYDKVMFTTLGSRVYNYFEQLLNIERERHQIPYQIRS